MKEILIKGYGLIPQKNEIDQEAYSPFDGGVVFNKNNHSIVLVREEDGVFPNCDLDMPEGCNFLQITYF